MIENSFSHWILWQNPIASLCFFAFAMSFFSLWVRKTLWLWGSFLLIAYCLALDAKIANWISILPVLILLICHYLLKEEIQKSSRFIFLGTVTLISIALSFHLMPGFNNWKVVSQLRLSPDALPYTLWLNFDKPFIGIFVLSFSLPLISSKQQLNRMLKITIPFTLLGICLLIGPSLYFDVIRWDPKIPVITFLWLISNLFFVAIPEEAFFRGFIQRQLSLWLGDKKSANLASIFITSICFTLIHAIWIHSLSFLGMVFVASMLYGTIYQWTKAIEGSILCHFCLNATHFFLFTYPALQH